VVRVLQGKILMIALRTVKTPKRCNLSHDASWEDFGGVELSEIRVGNWIMGYGEKDP
jgi:hypothetical protein